MKLECLFCHRKTSRIVRRWQYRYFDVIMVQCKCGRRIRGYFRNNSLEFTLPKPTKEEDLNLCVAVLSSSGKVIKEQRIPSEVILLHDRRGPFYLTGIIMAKYAPPSGLLFPSIVPP